MEDKNMPHKGHEKHLCYLQEKGYIQSNPEDYKKLVKNGQYYCTGCGRVAAKSENLCAPEKL
ncbi:MAG: hypothetical protein NTX88_07890 [Candidatus Atribacteria bacterium]|nr:hypothetical protein [Candidatus Atribacteria bacterium]